ncbi:MAG: transposase [Oscillospiraceae bacterium]|nr:transposase [Oscillospiraceae bacterium]
MARQARKVSRSGIYHIMLRGINQQMIFEDGEDEDKYLELLKIYKKRCGFELYGYCLMGNHVHLLLKEAAKNAVITVNGRDVDAGPGESLETVFKRIGVAYVTYYNRKYKRSGHLFQDRFRSEPVESDAYLLMALRYIHRNPVKAGICILPEEYLKSSYCAYIQDMENTVADPDYVLGMITREQLKEYTVQPNDDQFLDTETADLLPKTDTEAKEVLMKISGCSSSSAFQKLQKPVREAYMRQLNEDGINIAQIGRITGYSRQVVYRALST